MKQKHIIVFYSKYVKELKKGGGNANLVYNVYYLTSSWDLNKKDDVCKCIILEMNYFVVNQCSGTTTAQPELSM